MPTTPEQRLQETTDIVRKEIEEISSWLAKPAGLTDEQRKHLIHSLRMLHWFMELLSAKDQIVVPRKQSEKKQTDEDLKKLLDKINPPQKPRPNPFQYPDFPPTAPDNPFLPKRKKKNDDEPRDPIDDIWRNDPVDWTYDPWKRRRRNGGFRLMCSADPGLQKRPSVESMRRNLEQQGMD